MVFLNIFFVFLFSSAQQVAAPTTETPTCRRNLVDMNRNFPPPIQQTISLCSSRPNFVVTQLKAAITEYLCLYHLDLQCIKNIRTLGASYAVPNRQNFEQNFERIVGSRYVNSWLHGDPSASYEQIALRSFSPLQAQSTGSEPGEFNALTSIAQMVANVVPYGRFLDIAATGFAGFGSSQKPLVDGNNYCGPAQEQYINGSPNGRGCLPDYNFNSYAVDSFLEQNSAEQARALTCAGTCEYYANLIARLQMANAIITHDALPIFDAKPTCLAGGRASFSFRAVDDNEIATMQLPSRPIRWNGLTGEVRHSQMVHANFDDQPHPERMIQWNVTSDLLMRNQVTATTTPNYLGGVNTLTVRAPDRTSHSPRPRSSAQRSNRYEMPGGPAPIVGDAEDSFHPSMFLVPESDRTRGLNQVADPALRGMALAAATVSGCCSVPEPNRSTCLNYLPTVDRYRPRGPNGYGPAVPQIQVPQGVVK